MAWRCKILSGPMGAACAYDGTKQIIYVADTGNDRVVKLEVEYDRPGYSPLHVYELFKAALWTDDLDKSLTFVADMAFEKYSSVLAELRPQFQNMVTGMGDMVLISRGPNVARYEMLHDEGGSVMASFPVYFCKHGNGNWKIYCF